MATLVKTSSGTWKVIIRKTDCSTTPKIFRLKRDECPSYVNNTNASQFTSEIRTY